MYNNVNLKDKFPLQERISHLQKVNCSQVATRGTRFADAQFSLACWCDADDALEFAASHPNVPQLAGVGVQLLIARREQPVHQPSWVLGLNLEREIWW